MLLSEGFALFVDWPEVAPVCTWAELEEDCASAGRPRLVASSNAEIAVGLVNFFILFVSLILSAFLGMIFGEHTSEAAQHPVRRVTEQVRGQSHQHAVASLWVLKIKG